MITDRLSGAFFLLMGLALYFYVIPNFIDRIDYGALHPDTVPNALSILLAISGAALIIKPTAHKPASTHNLLRASVFLLVLVFGVWVMSMFGFEVIASPLALVIMVLIGERRPAWLFIGVALIPFLIWLAVDIGLGRNLP